MKNHSHGRVAGIAAFLFAASLAASASVRAQAAAPAFAGIFSDHAVLQRGEPLTVWGTAPPGQRVTVSLAGKTAEAIAGANGRWRVSMPAMTAGGPHILSVAGDSGGATLKDIMIGDVYLCGGQSNMAFPARLSTGAWPDFPANPDLRFINIQLASEPAAQDDLKRPVEWKVVPPSRICPSSSSSFHLNLTPVETPAFRPDAQRIPRPEGRGFA